MASIARIASVSSWFSFSFDRRSSMKKSIIAGILLSSSLSIAVASTVGQVCTTQGMVDNGKLFGHVTCGVGTLDSVSILGKADFSGTTVTNMLTVHGPLDAENANLNTVTVLGHAEMDRTVLKGNLTMHGKLSADRLTVAGNSLVYGYLKAEDSKFNNTVTVYGALNSEGSSFTKPLTVYGSATNLEDSTTQGITIKEYKHPTANLNYLVRLKDRTMVNGNITFVGPKPGVVYVGRHAKLNGKVINGSLQTR